MQRDLRAGEADLNHESTRMDTNFVGPVSKATSRLLIFAAFTGDSLVRRSLGVGGSLVTGPYGRGGGLGRILGVTFGLAVGVGLAVAVGVAVGVVVVVAVAVTVAVGVAVGVCVAVAVAVGVAVGVTVGVCWSTGAWTTTVMGDPVLKKPIVAYQSVGGRSASNRKLYNVPKRIAFAF